MSKVPYPWLIGIDRNSTPAVWSAVVWAAVVALGVIGLAFPHRDPFITLRASAMLLQESLKLQPISEVRYLPAGDPMVDPLLWHSKKLCKLSLFSMFGLFGLMQSDRLSSKRPTSKGALSTWNSPFRQSYRRSSQPVLNQLCDFGSQGCRFKPCRVQ